MSTENKNWPANERRAPNDEEISVMLAALVGMGQLGLTCNGASPEQVTDAFCAYSGIPKEMIQDMREKADVCVSMHMHPVNRVAIKRNMN
jgi:hypothetical protein